MKGPLEHSERDVVVRSSSFLTFWAAERVSTSSRNASASQLRSLMAPSRNDTASALPRRVIAERIDADSDNRAADDAVPQHAGRSRFRIVVLLDPLSAKPQSSRTPSAMMTAVDVNVLPARVAGARLRNPAVQSRPALPARRLDAGRQCIGRARYAGGLAAAGARRARSGVRATEAHQSTAAARAPQPCQKAFLALACVQSFRQLLFGTPEVLAEKHVGASVGKRLPLALGAFVMCAFAVSRPRTYTFVMFSFADFRTKQDEEKVSSLFVHDMTGLAEKAQSGSRPRESSQYASLRFLCQKSELSEPFWLGRLVFFFCPSASPAPLIPLAVRTPSLFQACPSDALRPLRGSPAEMARLRRPSSAGEGGLVRVLLRRRLRAPGHRTLPPPPHLRHHPCHAGACAPLTRFSAPLSPASSRSCCTSSRSAGTSFGLSTSWRTPRRSERTPRSLPCGRGGMCVHPRPRRLRSQRTRLRHRSAHALS